MSNYRLSWQQRRSGENWEQKHLSLSEDDYNRLMNGELTSEASEVNNRILELNRQFAAEEITALQLAIELSRLTLDHLK